MYSNEIQKVFEANNYYIDSEMFVYICNTSSQIILVEYSPYENNTTIATDDGYRWVIRVYKKG